jgi:hypothetical protein
VILKDRYINAHATVMTVTKVVATADTTKATIVAVIRFFLIGHPEIAQAAMISTELNVALHTRIAVERKPNNVRMTLLICILHS